MKTRKYPPIAGHNLSMRLDPNRPLPRPHLPASREGTTTPQVRPAAAPPAEAGLLDRLSGFMGKASSFVKHLFQPAGLWTNPDLAVPPDRGGIKVTSYNILLKGQHLDRIERDLRNLDADVVCLQEASEDSAKQLAARLGMHATWHENPFHAYGGTAVLSRYPITESRTIDLINPMGDRLRETWRKFRQGDPRLGSMDARHLTHATIQVGDRSLSVLNGHLTLFGAETNAKQLDQITEMARNLEAQGHSVIVTGDFNTNFGFAGPGVEDSKGSFETPTDTPREFKDRVGMNVGNNGHPAGKAAMDRLTSHLQNFWEAETRTVLVGGQLMTPDQAREELAGGKVPVGSDRYKQLVRVMDGSTVLGASKRFDNIFASRDVRITSAHIDQTTRASDHQPVTAEIRWD